MDKQKWLQDAIDKIEKMSPDELHRSMFGYTKEEYEKYEHEHFLDDLQLAKEYFKTKEYYSLEYAAYHPEEKINFFDQTMFLRVFYNKGTRIGVEDMHESTTVYDGIKMDTIHGQGSCTTLCAYEPKETDIHHNVLDYENNHVKYVVQEGTEKEMSASTDNLSTHVSIRHSNGLFSMSKEEFKTFRDILNMIKLEDEQDGW